MPVPGVQFSTLEGETVTPEDHAQSALNGSEEALKLLYIDRREVVEMIGSVYSMAALQGKAGYQLDVYGQGVARDAGRRAPVIIEITDKDGGKHDATVRAHSSAGIGGSDGTTTILVRDKNGVEEYRITLAQSDSYKDPVIQYSQDVGGSRIGINIGESGRGRWNTAKVSAFRSTKEGNEAPSRNLKDMNWRASTENILAPITKALKTSEK